MIYGENKRKLQTLEKENYFGELSFFTSHPKKFGVRSSAFSSIFELQKTKFIELLELYPPEKETFYFIEDMLLLNDDYRAIKSVCYSCNKEGHDIAQCSFLHYTPVLNLTYFRII